MKQIFALLVALALAAGGGPIASAPEFILGDTDVYAEVTPPPEAVPAPAPDPVPAPEPVPEPAPVPEPVPEPENTTITLSFTGDMMLATYLDKTTAGNFNGYVNKNPPEYFLQDVAPIFREDDFTFVNLENVLSDRNLTPRDKGEGTVYWYKARTANTAILTTSGVEGVSLVNNHTRDYGDAGKKDTIAAVEAAGLLCGTDTNVVRFEKDGYRIAILCAGLWNEGGAQSILQRLKAEEGVSDFQIVFFHGGKERIHAPEEWKVRAAHSIVDGGADLVLGGHPHVLQPLEVYNDTEILYSLGNFCYGGSSRPENRTVIYQLTLTLDQNRQLVGKESTLVPCYVYTGERNNFRPQPIGDEAQRQKVLDFMAWKVDSPL